MRKDPFWEERLQGERLESLNILCISEIELGKKTYDIHSIQEGSEEEYLTRLSMQESKRSQEVFFLAIRDI